MRIGIDLGGTKIEGIALAGNGRELARIRVATPRDDYAATLETVRDLVIDLEAQAAAAGGRAERWPVPVGIGIPGTVSPTTGLVKNANSTWLIGQPLDTDLERLLERPVRLENDANCFGVSEAVDGAAAGADVAFAVILGTGVGGAVVVAGKALQGANAIAGEWGHNPLPWPTDAERPGPTCYCGRRGCIETFLSGPGLAADHGGGLTAEAIAAQAADGDATAEAALRRYEQRLARALASVINILDPEVIVLGGGMSNLDRLYAAVPALWGDWVFSDSVETRLVRNRHGDSSGVRGAAWLWD